MPLRPEYTLLHSDLAGFLGASVWDEENGNPLSVLSAFARLDIDPWGEATRLKSLPRAAAVSALADTLARLPWPRRTRPNTAAIADRLVALLPKPGTEAEGGTEGSDRQRMNGAATWLIWLALAALFFLVLKSGLVV